MRRSGAASQLREWFALYASTVDGALRRFGVADRAERENLAQDVILAGYLALERGEVIENPPAWLHECARKYASNYRRKAQRQMLTDDRPIVSAVPTPEQIVEHRELLLRLFEGLSEEDQRLILDVRVEGLSWSEVARRRGIKVSQAIYLYDRAFARLNEALARLEPKRKKRLAIVLPLVLARFFDAIRAPADTLSLELDSPPVPVWRACSVLATLGRRIAIGLVLGYLLRGSPVEPSPEPSHARSIPVIAREEPPARALDVQASAPLFATIESATRPREPSARSPRVNGSTLASNPLEAASAPDSMKLLEHARSAMNAGSVGMTLSLLAQHESRFPDGANARFYRALLRRVCATPAARGAPACAALLPGPTPGSLP